MGPRERYFTVVDVASAKNIGIIVGDDITIETLKTIIQGKMENMPATSAEPTAVCGAELVRC